jgi:hypothetical protein
MSDVVARLQAALGDAVRLEETDRAAAARDY